nr:hypothetical protein Itr_chr02CG10390 [Ipomoea trifida]
MHIGTHSIAQYTSNTNPYQQPAKTSNWVDGLSRPAMRLQRRSVGHCAGDDEDERQSSDRRSRTVTVDVTEGDGFCGRRGRLNYPEIFVGKTQLWNPT